LKRTFGEEVALCQRYYEKSYALGTDPGTATTVGVCYNRNAQSNNNDMFFSVPFKVTKRATPTITLYDGAGTSSRVFHGSNGEPQNVFDANEHQFVGGTNDTTDTRVLYFQFVADAEL